MITREFKLYLNAGVGVAPVINANQFDQSEEWVFTLLQSDGTVYTPSTGAIIGLKQDGTTILNAGTVNDDGQVVITETEQITAVPGSNLFEILIDGNTHGTANFVVFVERRPGDIDHPSESDISLFQEAITAAGNVTQFQADISALQSGLSQETQTRQAQDTSLASQIAQEANARSQQDAVLQAEIDQIIAPSGEAPSAAEVQNARIGADGTTYDTLGNAIRGQVSDLKNALSDVSNINFLINGKLIAGYCSNTGGFNTDGTTYHRTDYLPVSQGQTIRTGKIRFVTYFNADKSYNSGVSVPSANTENTFTVPVDGYVIISVYNTSISDGTLFGTFGDGFNIFTEKALNAIIATQPSIYQTTGQNTGGTMSQKATTDAVGACFNSLGTLSNASIYSVTKNGAYIITDETVTGKPETGVGYLNVFKPNSGFALLLYYAYPTKTLYFGVGYNGALYGSWGKINTTISQETGTSTTATMSQKAITDAIDDAVGGDFAKVNKQLLKDKKIVVLGDSIFGNNDSDTGVASVMQSMIEGEIKNCAFGGTRYTVRSQTNGYEQFDFGNLVQCIINNDYTPLNNAISGYSLPTYYQSRVNRLAGIDFSTVDTVMLFYGTNDYSSGITESVLKPSVIASINALQSAYKNLKIIVCSPTWRFWYTVEDGTGTYNDDSDTRNFGGGTLIQYCGYIKDIADSEHLPFINSYNIGINKNNYSQYFNDHDGTHHDVAGRAMLAEYLVRQLLSIG